MRLPSTQSEPSATAKRPRSSAPTSVSARPPMTMPVRRARPGRGTSRSSACRAAMRLEARRSRSPRPCPRSIIEELQQLDHGLDAQRAGLHRILEEVRLEEPLAGVDVLLAAHAAESGVPPSGPRPVTRSSISSMVAGEPRGAAAVALRAAREIDGRRRRRSKRRALVGAGRGARPGSRRPRLGEEAEHRLQLVDTLVSPAQHRRRSPMIMPPAATGSRGVVTWSRACRVGQYLARARCRCRRGCGTEIRRRW